MATATDDRADSLAMALVELQKELPHIGKGQTADTGSYTYDYADLTTISEQVMPLLGKHGLAFMAKPTLRDGQLILAYSLLHVSGQREDGEYPLGTGTPQVIGSAITYARRYVLCAVTGVAPGGSDDDGAAATAGHREQPAMPDPLTAAKAAVKDSWERHMFEPFSVEPAAEHFASWSEGEILAEATVERLLEYAAHLKAAPKEAQDKVAERVDDIQASPIEPPEQPVLPDGEGEAAK